MEINELKIGSYYCIDNGEMGHLIIQIIDSFVARVILDMDNNPNTKFDNDFKVIINTYKDKNCWEITKEELDAILFVWNYGVV